MKKTISITANNRPHYLEKVIDSLSKNDIYGYDKLYCALEPGNDKNVYLCESIDFIDTEIMVNPRKLGVRRNPYEVLDRLFKDDSQFNVYLEDDSILSNDALRFADFFLLNHDPVRHIHCSFYHYLNIDSFKTYSVLEWDNFVAIGMAFTKESWEKWLKPYWFNDLISKEMKIGGIGWDWSIRSVIKKYNLKVMSPVIPRSMHIGVVGTYCKPSDHRKLFGGRDYFKGKVDKFEWEKNKMMRIVHSCYEEKVCDFLTKYESGKCCILFNHGLGDFILFLPIFEELVKRFEKWDLYIGCTPDRNFKYLHPKVRIIDAPYGKYGDEFDIMCNIQYPDAPRNLTTIEYYKKLGIEDADTISKPHLCNKMEIGLDSFEWKPYKLNVKGNKVEKKVGVHFFGYSKGKEKNVPMDIAEKLWDSLKMNGFIPFEIQMIPIEHLNVIEQPSFISKEETLRFEFPNLKKMCEEIATCSLFVGVDSGPLYLAMSILGPEKCIGLEGLRKFDKVLPHGVVCVEINSGEILNKIIEVGNDKN